MKKGSDDASPEPGREALRRRALLTFENILFLCQPQGQDEATITLPRAVFENVIRHYLSLIPFDEAGYLASAPDVQAAVDAGHLASGLQHFLRWGFFEGRGVSTDAIVEYYELNNPDAEIPIAYLQRLSDAWASLRAGDPRSAESSLWMALGHYPAGAQAAYALAELLLGEGRPLQALEALASFSGPLPSHARIWAARGRAADCLLLTDVAIASYRRAVVQSGGHADYTLRLGQALSRRGRASEALRTFRAVGGMSIGAEGLARVEMLGALIQDIRNKLRGLFRTRRARPLQIGEWAELAHMLARLGFYRRSRAVMTSVMTSLPIGASPRLAWVICDASRIAAGAGAALDAWMQCKDRVRPDDELRSVVVGLLYETGRHAEAVREARQIINLDGDSYRYWVASLFCLGDRAEALEVARHWRRSAAAGAGWAASTLMGLCAGGELRHVPVRSAGAVTGTMQWGRRIPRMIIQYWHAPDPPPDVVNVLASWQDKNPYFGYRRFDDELAAGFLRERYGERILTAFCACRHPAMRSDFFRLCYLAKLGGIYVDADERCLIPVDQAVSLRDEELLVVRNELFYLFSSPFACAPGNSLVNAMLEQATSVLTDPTTDLSQFDTWHHLGPGLLTRTLAGALQDAPDRAAILAPIAFLSQADSGRFSFEEFLAYKATPEGNWRLR